VINRKECIMNETKSWLAAVEAFRRDINATVSCPACKNGSLKVTDVPVDGADPSKGGERYLKCSHCGRAEITLYRYPPSNWLGKQKPS